MFCLYLFPIIDVIFYARKKSQDTYLALNNGHKYESIFKMENYRLSLVLLLNIHALYNCYILSLLLHFMLRIAINTRFV